jgi:hypothetical protein
MGVVFAITLVLASHTIFWLNDIYDGHKTLKSTSHTPQLISVSPLKDYTFPSKSYVGAESQLDNLQLQIYHENNARRNVTLPTPAFLVPDSPLYDKTLPWDADIPRLWWLPQNQEQQGTPPSSSPPAMLLLTTLGWNAPNQSEATRVYRGLRLRELMDGILHHPWFHPTAWYELNAGLRPISNTTRYYIVLDLDMCLESNYPFYGRGFRANADWPGRYVSEHATELTIRLPLDEIMQSPLLQQAPHISLSLWDCGGLGPLEEFISAQRRLGPKVSIVSLSASQSQLRPGARRRVSPHPRSIRVT